MPQIQRGAEMPDYTKSDIDMIVDIKITVSEEDEGKPLPFVYIRAEAHRMMATLGPRALQQALDRCEKGLNEKRKSVL